jgi:transposase-like protein
MQNISFKRHRFPPSVNRHAVWLYARFPLSYRDIEDLPAERGLDISYETVRRWFRKFGGPIARNLRRSQPIPCDYWLLDEMVIVIRGKRHWLWRAVDNEGEVLDFLVQSKRNARAALKLIGKLLKKQGWPSFGTMIKSGNNPVRKFRVCLCKRQLFASDLPAVALLSQFHPNHRHYQPFRGSGTDLPDHLRQRYGQRI